MRNTSSVILSMALAAGCAKNPGPISHPANSRRVAIKILPSPAVVSSPSPPPQTDISGSCEDYAEEVRAMIHEGECGIELFRSEEEFESEVALELYESDGQRQTCDTEEIRTMIDRHIQECEAHMPAGTNPILFECLVARRMLEEAMNVGILAGCDPTHWQRVNQILTYVELACSPDRERGPGPWDEIMRNLRDEMSIIEIQKAECRAIAD